MDWPISLSIHPDEFDKVEDFSNLDEIEVYYTRRYPETDMFVDDVDRNVEEQGLTPVTSHLTRVADLGEPSGYGSLKSKALNVLTDYPSDSEDFERFPRESMSDVTVLNVHAPYKDDSELSERAMLEHTLRNIWDAARDVRDEAGREDIVFTLENSAKPHNLLSSTQDVRRLDRVASQMDDPVEDEIYFTYDANHHPPTDNPGMVPAMGDRIRNVHISDYVHTSDEELVEMLEGWFTPETEDSPRESEDPVGMREREGYYGHLPPGVGYLDLQETLSQLADQGYEGPLTVEMDRTVKGDDSWGFARGSLEGALEDLHGYREAQ